MMSSLYYSAVKRQLESSCILLRDELIKTGEKFIVRYKLDSIGSGCIEVYGNTAHKAYVPKYFRGWEIKFFTISVADIVDTIDLDQEFVV